MTPPKTKRLFISYRSNDSAKVDKIAGNLALLKYDDGTPRYITWQDKHDLPVASPNWWDAIIDAIVECDMFVFNLSLGSLESEVCRAELDYAHRRNRPIIPVVLDGEYFLIPSSDKYDLPKETWKMVPDWLSEQQFLFVTGAKFYSDFEKAVARYERNWPRDLPAPRPLNPNNKSVQGNPHALYAAACDYAHRLAFTDAENHFLALVRRNDPIYADPSAHWIERIRAYAELIEVVDQRSPSFVFKKMWAVYEALPTEYLDGEIFDPKGLAARALGAIPSAKVQEMQEKLDTQTVVPESSLTAEELVKRAQEKYQNKDYDGAIADYTEAIRLNPTRAGAYLTRGDARLRKSDYDGAIADYTEAIRLNPTRARAYEIRGNARYMNGDYDGAIADYTEAIRLRPTSAWAYATRGDARCMKGDRDGAIADATESIRLDPTSAKAYETRGDARCMKWDLDGAIEDLTEAIRLDPTSVRAYATRGDARCKLEDYDGAIADASEALRLDPNNGFAYRYRAIARITKDDFTGAFIDAKDAVRLAPDSLLMIHPMLLTMADHSEVIAEYVARASARLNKGDFVGTIADTTEAIEMHSDLTITDTDKVIKSRANLLQAYYLRGEARRMIEDYDGAIDDANEAIRLDPTSASAYRIRGDARRMKHDYDGAVDDLTQSSRLDALSELTRERLDRAKKTK